MNAPTVKDLLDDAAARAVAGLGVDPRAALEAAAGRRRTAFARRTVLVAASVAALLVVALSLLPAVQRAAPQPADRPSGPGGIPGTLHLPPSWTPSITERPISRAVYVASAVFPPDSEEDAPTSWPVRQWLVGADGGEYRLLPEKVGSRALIALSGAGSRVAWTADGRYGSQTRLVTLDVGTGERRDVDLPGSVRRGLTVGALAFSPDERSIAVAGLDGLGAGTDRAVLALVDVASGATTTVCRMAGSGPEPSLAWTGTGRLAVDGGCAGTPGGGVDIEIAPAVPDDAPLGYGGAFGSLGHGVTVLSADGRTRYDLARADRQDAPLRLVGSGAEAGDVRLGDWSGAAAFGLTARGVVVGRWGPDPADPGGAPSVPADVAVVDPVTGAAEVLTTADGTAPRVIAAAAQVLADGRGVDATVIRPRVLDVAWWSWLAAGASGWVVGLPAYGWLALAGLGWLLAARRLPVRVRRAVFWGAVACLLTIMFVPLGLPGEATAAPRPPGSPVVLPQVLRDVRLVPPRAFDAAGRPRTTRVGLLYAGSLAGRPGLYATDAATGTWVRLDDLPGLEGYSSGELDPNGAVSPNGRFVLVGAAVVDLEVARVREFDLDAGEQGVMPSGISTSTAVLDDGTVVAALADGEGTLRVLPPGAGRAHRVAAVTGVSEVEAQCGTRVLVRFFSRENTDEPEDLTSLVDLATSPPTVTALGAEQDQPVAVLGSTQARLDRDGLVVDRSWDPGRAGPVGEWEPVAQPGATDAVWLAPSAGPDVLVTLGSTPRTDLAVVRTPLAGGTGSPEPLTTIEVGRDDAGTPHDPRGAFAVAPEVVAQASPIDVPAEPWWARFRGAG